MLNIPLECVFMENKFGERGRKGTSREIRVSCNREKQDHLQDIPAFFTGYLSAPLAVIFFFRLEKSGSANLDFFSCWRPKEIGGFKL